MNVDRTHQSSYYIAFIEVVVDLGGLVVSVLATGPKVRGFDPFNGDKNQEHHFLRRGSKAVCPMS
jgi:hypothetical protein